MPSSKLGAYRSKRDFARTSEPHGVVPPAAGNRFVVHKHQATADHYDLRLEHDGVLKSWAVPRGPSLNPDDKRLAVETEDHPLEYIDFEAVIPKGEYGGGPMIVWDTGTWAPMEDVETSLAQGAFKFRLAGEKLSGGWMLTRLKPKPGEANKKNWLLFKEYDPAASRSIDILAERPESVKTGRRIEELTEAAPVTPKRTVKLQPGRLAGAVKAAMPRLVEPQLASVATDPPKGDGWLHEIKFDGYRTMAYRDGDEVKLVTRSGIDWTRRYGDLPEAFRALAVKQAIIDGEIVVLDETGVSRFALLQDALSAGAGNKLVFYAFDLLYLDGWDLHGSPLKVRKGLLAQLLAGHLSGRSAIQFSDHVEGSGSDLYRKASEMGLEGIVSKRADARYESGRSANLVKVKARMTGDFVIAGYTASEAAGGLGALALGEWEDGELRYRGKVGTGFDAATLSMLRQRIIPLREGAPALEGAPRDIIPVRPLLSAHILYANRTGDNMLRHSVFIGLREAALTAAPAAERVRLISDADLATIWVTNPTRRLFGKSGPTKLDVAVYYAAVGDFMLPHIFNRPVSLVRCPTGRPQDCFFQRHAFTGMPSSVGTFESTNSEGETKTYLTVEDARGYLALAQFGVIEFHSWGTRQKHLEKPDQIIFDLDPGEGIGWREVVEAAVHVKGELEGMGLVPFVKTSGGRGIHVVVPIVPKLGWKAVHQFAAGVSASLAKSSPDTFVAVMGKDNRKRRIFVDFHRNARSATAAAVYSLRARTNLPASTPLGWRDLEAVDAPEDLNYSSLPGLLTTTGDPWIAINESARELPASSRSGK